MISNREWHGHAINLPGSMILLALSSASVFAQNPTMTWLSDLSFGMVINNTTNTTAYADPDAGSFITMIPSYASAGNASLTFTLPTQLVSGANRLPVSFGTNSAAYNSTNATAGATTFNPATGHSGSLPANTTITRYFWIGGTVTPANNQAAGTYTGTITATLTITVGTQIHTANLVINVTATVIRGLSQTVTGSLDFGVIVAGTTVPALSAQSNPTAPMFLSAGTLNRNITVTYSASSALNDGYGHSLTFTPGLYGSTSDLNQTTSTAVASGATVTLRGTTGGTGYYYFWLGGALTPSPIPFAQPAGSYNGTFTLTVHY